VVSDINRFLFLIKSQWFKRTFVPEVHWRNILDLPSSPYISGILYE